MRQVSMERTIRMRYRLVIERRSKAMIKMLDTILLTLLIVCMAFMLWQAKTLDEAYDLIQYQKQEITIPKDAIEIMGTNK